MRQDGTVRQMMVKFKTHERTELARREVESQKSDKRPLRRELEGEQQKCARSAAPNKRTTAAVDLKTAFLIF